MILISPKARRLGIFEPYVPISVPMGLGYLAGYLELQGEPILIHDEEVQPLDDEALEALVAGETAPGPLVFGFSCVTAGIARAMNLAKTLKEKYPDCLIVMGGVHPSLVPEDPLLNSPADLVVIGQGEQTMHEVLKTFRSGERNFEKVNSVAFNRDGKVVRTSPRKKFLGLNDLPDFPYHLFEKHIERYDLGWIVSSYGCPFDCIFCSQRFITDYRVSYSDNDKVLRQIRLLVERYNVKHIWFADDNLSIKKKRIISLCDDIVAAGLHEKVSFDCQTRADGVNPEVLDALKRANFRMISFGLEVASERLMKFIAKGETLEDCVKAVRMAKESGLKVSGCFIIGWPSETQEERRACYDLASELDLDVVRFNVVTPYPGTPLYDMVKDEPGFNPGKGWIHMNTVGALVSHPFKKPLPLSYVPPGMTEAQLRRTSIRYNLLYSLRPSLIINILKDGVNLGGHFTLPPRWYLNPKEIAVFVRFCLYTLGSLVRGFI